METLTSSAGSKLTFDKQRHRYFFSSKELYVNNRPQLTFLPSKNHVNGRFSELLSLRNKTVQAISYIQADSQGEMENVAQEEHIYESNTVHVKFQIQKECRFGERFFVVGDDPIFGLWDPESAIPLDWSEEHVWSVELDLPVGKTIQFKFMLKEATGDILWQPGADRTIQTWETKNTITILEDWDNAEYQKIIEEEPAANQNGKLDVESEVILADEFIQPKKELVFGLGDTSDAANTDMDRSTTPDNRRAATVNKSSDDEGNLISHEGEPVLVSGLTPLEAVSTETDIQNDNQSADASLVMNEAQNHSLPELEEKQEPESDPQKVKIFEVTRKLDVPRLDKEEEEPNKTPLQTDVKHLDDLSLAKQEQDTREERFGSNVVQNDIQWGRRTLQMPLTNLGLL